MSKKSTFFSWIWDDIEIDYFFFIPPTNKKLSDNETIKLLKDIVDFHRDYHKISKHYQFGEIFTKEYLDFLETDIEEVFFSNLEDAIFDTDFSFFPVKNEEIDLDMMFSSKLFYHDNRNQIVENYVYGMYSGKSSTGLCDFQYWQKNKDLADKPLEFFFYPTDKLGEFFVTPIQFKISIKSNLFFPKIGTGFLKENSIYKYGENIENDELYYLNTTRFNSFLRDLKKIFVKKYGWKFQFKIEESTLKSFPFVTESGIKINNEIIYSEATTF